MNISIRCRCGKLRGEVKQAERSFRFFCYCDDCQQYLRHLGAEDLLDANGGTEIIPVAPANLSFTQGTEQLRCLRLTPKGMDRWYAGCCRTPIANTRNPKMPWAGVVNVCLDRAERDAAQPRVTDRTWGKFAIGQPPPGTAKIAGLGLFLRVVRFLSTNWLAGRAQPSPFYDANGGARVEPEIIKQP